MEKLGAEKTKEVLFFLQQFFNLVPIAGFIFDWKEEWNVHDLKGGTPVERPCGVEDSGSFFFGVFHFEEKLTIRATLPRYLLFYDAIITAMMLRYGWKREDIFKSFFRYLEENMKFSSAQYPDNYDADLHEKLLQLSEAKTPGRCLTNPEATIKDYLTFLRKVNDILKISEESFKEAEDLLFKNIPDKDLLF